MVVAASGAPGVGRAFSLDRHVVVQKNVCVAGHTRALSLYGRLPLPRRALSTTAADSKTKSGDPLFAPIEEHAILGDTRSAALVTREGCIDWMCLPRFDADPVFARLLDAEHGGRFELSIEGAVSGRRYRRDSAVLETSWHGASGTGLITEAMALDVKGMRPQLVLVRTVECTSGTIEVRALFEPRGGPDHVDARGSGRWAQLGRQVFVATGRRHRFRCLDELWRTGGSRRLHALVEHRKRAHPAANVSSVHAGWDARPPGAGATRRFRL